MFFAGEQKYRRPGRTGLNNKHSPKERKKEKKKGLAYNIGGN